MSLDIRRKRSGKNNMKKREYGNDEMIAKEEKEKEKVKSMDRYLGIEIR